MCAKHYENPTMLSRVTAKNVGDVFLRHTVYCICRRNGRVYPKRGGGSGVIWLDEVNCAGNERNIGNCDHSGWDNTYCNHDKDIYIACDDDSPPRG